MTRFDSQQGKNRFYRDKRIYLYIYLRFITLLYAVSELYA